MDERRKILYSYWEKLPPLKIIPQGEEEIYSHKIRLWVIRILRRGIIDPSYDNTRRRALNAREILAKIKERQGKRDESDEQKSEPKDISLQSLYFHLQKLEELNLIQTVTILREGRHNTAYYGRTARIYLHTDLEKIVKKTSQSFSAIQQFGTIKNPDFDHKKFAELTEKFLEYEKRRSERISKWLIQYESVIIEENLDLTSFFHFMEIMDNSNPTYQAILNELKALLLFDSLP